MSRNRDDFPARVRHQIEKKSAYRCATPDCRRVTIGPSEDFRTVRSMGVVAHICAAALGGPRYDPAMTPEERAGEENGLLLCQYCAALVDRDENAYPAHRLRMWKERAYRLGADALAEPADAEEDPRCWAAVRRLVRECLCTYQTQGAVSPEAKFRSYAGILYRLLFEELPGAKVEEQTELWARAMHEICMDGLEPVRCRRSHYNGSFLFRYRYLMEELHTYSLRPEEKKSRLLNVIEDEVRELFRTGEAFGLVRNNGREDF